MESKYNFRMTQKANADLDDIIFYIAVELSDPKAATDFMDKFQAIIEETRLFPESGSLVENDFMPETKVRKKLVNHYIMYYLPDFTQKEIVVLRIVYGKRSTDEILRKLDI